MKEWLLLKINNGQVPDELTLFQSRRQESYQEDGTDTIAMLCFVKIKRWTVKKLKLKNSRILKRPLESSEKIQEAEKYIELKDIQEETKKEGRSLNGKLWKERWSLFVDAEEKSFWKSYQLKELTRYVFFRGSEWTLKKGWGLEMQIPWTLCPL